MKLRRLTRALLAGLTGVFLAPSRAAGAFENVLPPGSVWRFHYDWNGQPPDVRTAGFDDSAWQQGPAQIGYGEGDEATMINPNPPNKPASYTGDKPITAYFRRPITVPAGAAAVLRLDLLRDDGAVIWLNGQELIRNNMPRGEITPATTAELSLGGTDETEPVRLYVPDAPLVPGVNFLVVEIHQATSTSNDISFDLGVEVWTGPEDSDADGLPDWWEESVFGGLTHPAEEDADHDGATNAEEFPAGTDPLNPASILRASISLNFTGRPMIEWWHVPGMSYRVLWSADLEHWTEVHTRTAISAGVSGWLDPTPAASRPTTRYYLVEAARLPWP